MTPVTLSESAKADIRRATFYYEAEKEGLGEKFLQRVLETIDHIEANPQGYAKVFKEARRANVPKFACGMWFKMNPDGSIIIACLHHKRDAVLARERALGIIEL